MMITNMETIERRRKEKGLRELTTDEKVRIFRTGIFIPPEKLSLPEQLPGDE